MVGLALHSKVAWRPHVRNPAVEPRDPGKVVFWVVGFAVAVQFSESGVVHPPVLVLDPCVVQVFLIFPLVLVVVDEGEALDVLHLFVGSVGKPDVVLVLGGEGLLGEVVPVSVGKPRVLEIRSEKMGERFLRDREFSFSLIASVAKILGDHACRQQKTPEHFVFFF